MSYTVKELLSENTFAKELDAAKDYLGDTPFHKQSPEEQKKSVKRFLDYSSDNHWPHLEHFVKTGKVIHSGLK